MKPFRFTLESVATVRRRQEQKAMEKYAQSLQAQRRAMDGLTQMEQELSACWQTLRTQLSGGCIAAKAAQVQSYESLLMQRRVEAQRAVELAERRVNADLQGMLKARQQREIVDNYFDKQKDAHDREGGRVEQKELDELAGRRRISSLAWNQMEKPA